MSHVGGLHNYIGHVALHRGSPARAVFLFVYTLGAVATRQHDGISTGHAAGATVALNPHCRPNHTESPVKVPIKDLGVLPWVGSCPAVFQ